MVTDEPGRAGSQAIAWDIVCLALVLVVCLLTLDLVAQEVSSPQTTMAESTPPPLDEVKDPAVDSERAVDSESAASSGERMTELVGFVVRGRRLHERLTIDDLDSIVASDGKRLLPLLRVLRAFKLEIVEENRVISFSPEGVGPVKINLEKAEIEIKGITRPLSYLETISEIMMKRDIYISPEDLSEILQMELEWDNALYEYRVQLDRSLSIWKVKSISLIGRTERAAVDLPEMLPRAESSQAPIDLFEFRWRPSYRWENSHGETDLHSLSLSSPQESIWGHFEKGRYKARISHPGLQWESNEAGWHWNNYDSYAAKVDWFEWVYRLPSAEITLGDSVLGLGELVYPTLQSTGIRINGLTGYGEDELESDQSSLGLRQFFTKPYIFEGPAPLGATVELLINDRTVETQEAFPEEDSAPGMGKYRFEDIYVPSGILNEITIVITEINGNEIRVEKSILGTPNLLPQGRAAYLGSLGTKRDLSVRNNKNVEMGDFTGEIAASRVLYGLTDRLTIGSILGFQRDYYERYLKEETSTGNRSYPESARHVGALFSYLPVDKLLLSGEYATSKGDGRDDYDDAAGRLRAEYLPTQKLSLTGDFINIGTNYFDGQDPEIADRRGGELGMAWKYGRKWSLETGMGRVRDNLDGNSDSTLVARYENIGLRTTAIPRTSLTFKLNRLSSNLDGDAQLLGELGLRASLSQTVNLFGQIYKGDELRLGDDNQFFSGLRLKNAPRFTGPAQYWSIRKSLSRGNTVGLLYSDTGIERLAGINHDLNIRVKSRPFMVHTEILKNLTAETSDENYRLRFRTEYLLDSVGYNRWGITAEYRDGRYVFLTYLNIRNLFSRHEKQWTNVNEQRVRTGQGAVHGKVFLDYNNNYRLDPGEPGIPDVKVSIGEMKDTFTDKNGYYILPRLRTSTTARVSLDMDTVPAIYSVTHGTQLARIFPESLTEVNLSVAPLVSISGRVVATDSGGKITPRSGVRVHLVDSKTSQLAGESFTAEDGSYYIGNVKPGDYTIQVDTNTLPKNHLLVEQKRVIQVIPTEEEFQEIELPDFVTTVTEEKTIP